ncbi:MAG: hypothetical protein WC861_01465 [Candidatus Micrarchaeia archaeon]
MALPNQPQSPQKGATPSSPATAPMPNVPTVSGFRIAAKRVKMPADISQRLSELSFLEMSTDKDALLVLNVESRDIQKNPFLFSVVSFLPSSIEAKYTCMPSTSPKRRRIDVLRHFLNLLTITEDCYSVKMQDVYQLLEAAVSDMTEYSSVEYDRLFGLYDSQKSESASMQKKLRDAIDGNASLSKENFELKSKNDELVLKLRSLETFSDPVLALKIQEWLSEHKGEINIADFSKVYNVPENRVEQMLNKLVTEGYIESKG